MRSSSNPIHRLVGPLRAGVLALAAAAAVFAAPAGAGAQTAAPPAQPAGAPAVRPQTPPSAPAGQRARRPAPIEVVPPVVNIGVVKPNSITPATFTLRNISASPVKVTAAMPSCKCTAITDVVGKTIEPGGSLELSASMKAPPVPGQRDAKVMIRLEGFEGVVEAKIDGIVEMAIVPEPAFVDALRGTTAGSIKVRSQDGKPFRILSAGGAAPSFVGFDPAKDEPRAEYTIQWSVAGLQTLPIWWTLETDRAEAPLLPLRVRHESTGSRWDPGRFERQWIVKDQIVFAGSMAVGVPTEATIELEHYNPRNQPLLAGWGEVTAITPLDPSIKVEILERKPLGTDYMEVKVRLTPSKPGVITTDLSITTRTGTGVVPFVAKAS